MNGYFKKQIEALRQRHEALLQRPNEMQEETNGIIRRYVYPVLTRQHIPLEWRYDFNPATNPCCMERIGFNATMNSGALKWNGKYLMVVRVEGADRKSFFAIAESPNGVDNFHFWKRPLVLPDVDPAETNVYDMRLTAHQDGWIYGIFCSERHDDKHRRRSVGGGGKGGNRTHAQSGGLGTVARLESGEPTAQCGVASRICEWEICPLHPSAG